MICLFVRCGHRASSEQHNVPEDSTGIRDGDRLICILPGYDSIIYYHGSSSHMRDIKRGVITDTVFTETLFRTVREHGYMLTLKPGDGEDVMTNFRDIVNLANVHDVSARSVLVIDANENKAFGAATPEDLTNAISEKNEPLKLQLPKDNTGSDDSIPNKYPKASQLIVLVAGDSGIYAYPRDHMAQGKKYTCDGLTEMLKAKAKDKNFFVVLRPSASCSYRNTVDALDIMKTTGIEHYGLFDIKKEEEDYLRQIYR